jgi:hypothetical protein
MRISPISTFTFDLSDEQRLLCMWVAEQARAGVRRVHYGDLKAAMHVDSDTDITRVLREIRERRDDIHAMVHSPIVNTANPYFDLHADADHIWDDYCRAEEELLDSDFNCQDSDGINVLCHSGYDGVTCAV